MPWARTIDLSGVDSSRFARIEKIDLTGAQANTLVLDQQAVLDMAGSNGDAFGDNTLLIKGDAADRVTILDGWTPGATVSDPFGETGSFVTYTNGAARLLDRERGAGRQHARSTWRRSRPPRASASSAPTPATFRAVRCRRPATSTATASTT